MTQTMQQVEADAQPPLVGTGALIPEVFKQSPGTEGAADFAGRPPLPVEGSLVQAAALLARSVECLQLLETYLATAEPKSAFMLGFEAMLGKAIVELNPHG
jgi:hypothetical protein